MTLMGHNTDTNGFTYLPRGYATETLANETLDVGSLPHPRPLELSLPPPQPELSPPPNLTLTPFTVGVVPRRPLPHLGARLDQRCLQRSLQGRGQQPHGVHLAQEADPVIAPSRTYDLPLTTYGTTLPRPTTPPESVGLTFAPCGSQPKPLATRGSDVSDGHTPRCTTASTQSRRRTTSRPSTSCQRTAQRSATSLNFTS